jgi:hypothetical protein
VPIRWFVAAVLALVAAVIPSLDGGRPNWAVAAAGLSSGFLFREDYVSGVDHTLSGRFPIGE